MSWIECFIYALLIFCVFPAWVFIVAKMAANGWNSGIYYSNIKITKEILKNGKKT
jgi:hypothetical protein